MSMFHTPLFSSLYQTQKKIKERCKVYIVDDVITSPDIDIKALERCSLIESLSCMQSEDQRACKFCVKGLNCEVGKLFIRPRSWAPASWYRWRVQRELPLTQL